MGLYGLLAEFETPEEMVQGALAAREKGYRKVEAYSPFPVEGIPGFGPEGQDLKHEGISIPAMAFMAGGATIIGVFLLQYIPTQWTYPLNIGGRPLNSWPAYIPIIFELTVFMAALTTFLAVLFKNGLPQYYHPLFNIKDFERASLDRFFLCIKEIDPCFDLGETKTFLTSLGARRIFEVPL